jgi:lysophospholipase L1-like esterase
MLRGAWVDGVLCLLATVFALSIAELSLRFIGLGHPIIYERSVLWGYSPLPNQSARRFNESHVTIDHNGFRISEPLQGGQQILFFGDSITYGGSYIDDTHIFSSLTCDILNAALSSSKYSCANAAVNAYGIRNMLSRARYVEKGFPSADMVLTVISEDFYRNFSQLSGLPYFTTKPPEPFPATFELLAFSLDTIRTWARFGHMLDIPFEDDSPDRLEADAAVDLVNEFLKGRRREGKETLVVWSPSRDWFSGTNGAKERYPYERLRQSGTDFIDMTHALKQSKTIASQIYYDDAHLQRDGHRVYAQAIAGVLHKRSRR